jgi:hypothetical protein
MRAFVLLATVFLGVLTLDAIAFGGRYREDAWEQARSQGVKWNYQMSYWLRKSGIVR